MMEKVTNQKKKIQVGRTEHNILRWKSMTCLPNVTGYHFYVKLGR